MKVLFDQGTPVPLRHAFTGHIVFTAYEMGWAELDNGSLLSAAEKEQFNVLVTTDKNLRHQQDIKARGLAILVLPTTSWPKLRSHGERIAKAAISLQRGHFLEFSI